MSWRADDAIHRILAFQGLHALCGLVPVATLEADGLEPRLVQTCHTCGAREAQTLTRVELERLVGVLRDDEAFAAAVRTAGAQLQRH